MNVKAQAPSGAGQMISDAAGLEALVTRLRDADVWAIDTEADSLHAYPEKLCLLQISARVGAPEPGADDSGDRQERQQIDVLVDPLAGIALDELLELAGTRALVLHGADFDLRLLYRTFGFKPARVFDTMLAARLLGETRFGLKALLESRLGVTIEKGPRKANWARRPLSPRMEAYATNDTRHLEALADGLRAELRARGRESWHAEMCARLVFECAREREVDEDRVWRLKGSSRLAPRELAVLRALWRWREAEATRANRPPYFVVAHEQLVAIASASGKGARVPLPPKLPPRRRRALLEAVALGRAVPAEERPKRASKKHVAPMSAAEQARLSALKSRRDQAAASLELEPSLIASKQALDRVARDPERGAEGLLEWQRALVL